MNVTNFHHKDGGLSSIRTSFGGFSSTSYMGSLRGGTTCRMGNSSMRFDNQGSLLGSSVTTGGGTTYFGRHGGVSSHIAAYDGDDW